MTHPRGFIEVNLPLYEISRLSARQKQGVRTGQIKALHTWRACCPTAASQAAVLAILLDAPEHDKEVERLEEVVAHEMVHRKHPNHSSEFWEYLAWYPKMERARGSSRAWPSRSMRMLKGGCERRDGADGPEMSIFLAWPDLSGQQRGLPPSTSCDQGWSPLFGIDAFSPPQSTEGPQRFSSLLSVLGG